MVTPLSGLPPASLTNTFNGLANGVFTCALCGDPATTVIEPAEPGEFVRLKVALTAPTVATTLYCPAVPFAVRIADVAKPEASVLAVFAPPANVALAPLPGTVNVTVELLIGLFP